MAAHPEWTTVVNTRKLKREAKFEARKQEQEKWKAILEECPHVVLPSRAERLKQRLNITNLDKKLTSDEWVNHQKKGWIYFKTFKPRGYILPQNTELLEFSALEIENGWGDKVVFYRLL